MGEHRWFDTAILPPVLRRAGHRWAILTVALLSVPAVLTGWTVGYLNDGPILPNIDHNQHGYLDAVPTLPAVETVAAVPTTSARRSEPVHTATPPRPVVVVPVVPPPPSSVPVTTTAAPATSSEPTSAPPTSAAETSSATPSAVMTGFPSPPPSPAPVLP